MDKFRERGRALSILLMKITDWLDISHKKPKVCPLKVHRFYSKIAKYGERLDDFGSEWNGLDAFSLKQKQPRRLLVLYLCESYKCRQLF